MNILELQEDLKDLPDRRLIQEMQMPTGAMPQFLVLSELTRRKRMRDDYKRQAAANEPTVAEEVVAGAGVPQGGLMAMAGAMAPKTNVAQDTGLSQAMPMQATRAPQPMSDGGIMRLNEGYKISSGTSIADTLLPARIEMVLTGGNANDKMVIAEQILTGMYGPEIQSQFTSQMLSGSYGDNLKNIAEQFNSVAASLDDSAPTVMGEGPSLQEINPDSTTFVAPETVSDPRERGALAFNRYSTGGLGAIPSVPNIPQMALDMPLSLNQIIDSGVGVRSADTNRAQQLADSLAMRRYDLPGVNLPGESYSYEIDPDAAQKAGESLYDDAVMADLMSQAKIEREGFGADDAPTFMGDVLPFLGRASIAAGTSLYDSLFPQKTVGPDDVIAELREQEAMRNADPIQDEINRLRAIISDPDASAPEKANAADALMKLQERIAVTQTGGDIPSTVAGEGIEAPEGFVMTALGPQPDPNYKPPGKTGQSIVDQAALQGSEALQELADTGLYPDGIIREAEKAATLSDFEKEINVINKDIMDVQNNLKNPYLPDDARAELEAFLKTAQEQKDELVNKTSVDELFVPPSVQNVPSIAGGYEGLIDTSPVTIAEQAAEAATEIAPKADERRDDDPELKLPTVTTDDNTDNVKPVTDPDPAGFGSTDSRIAKMLSERQKQAESDKWMALAQAGFKMMTSKSPTLLGAVGEGGEAGLKALSASKKGLRDFETDMLKLETQLAAARLRSQNTAKLAPAALVTAAASRLRTAKDTLDNAVSPVEKQNALDAYNAALEEYNNINAFVASQYGYTPSSSTGVGNNVPNLSDSANQSANQ